MLAMLAIIGMIDMLGILCFLCIIGILGILGGNKDLVDLLIFHDNVFVSLGPNGNGGGRVSYNDIAALLRVSSFSIFWILFCKK